jgi:hypothetical protein
MRPILLRLFAFGLSTLTTVLVWSQTDVATRRAPVPALVGVDSSATPSVDTIETSHPSDRMLTPPPVSGQMYPTQPLSEEHSNYFRYGLSFTSAYTDNVLGESGGAPISDISYSIAPNTELDVTTSRVHWMASYTPGFTFYQRTRARNEADHRAAINFQYRLWPHVTVSAQDGFWKSSNAFSQADLASTGGVSGGTQQTNPSVIAPIADQLNNSGYVGLTYQFALNGMIGANGTFTNLHYPNPEQVPGLSDSSSQSGSAFYSLRLAKVHYFGVIYQYQRLIAHPSNSFSETQTQAGMLFYSFLPSRHFSLSLFGGPQYADTVGPTLSSSQGALPEVQTLSPAAGASVNWQGRLTAVALSYAHMVAPGSGLAGAVHLDSGTLSLTRRFTAMLSGAVAGGYSQNEYFGSQLPGNNGTSIYEAVSLQRQLGQRVSVELGYTHLHQSYAGVEVLSATPDINRGFVSISYQFSRPLGR